MQKKLLISIDEQIYYGLLRLVGRGKISRFFEDLARPYLSGQSLDEAYKAMAADKKREKQALDWSNAMIGDVTDEKR
jgi:hypothetical protein